jgi:hypothetical protein
MTKTMIAAAIISALLAGCASPGSRLLSVACSTSTCPIIEVSVVGVPPQLRVNTVTLSVDHGNNDANIMWKLKDSPGYEFQADSIAFKDPRRAATQFSLVNWSKDTFHMKDRNKDDVYAYAYQIKVYETTTGIWIPLDPWVVNN